MTYKLNCTNRGRSSVVSASEDPGFEPLAGQGEEQVGFFMSPRVNCCPYLFVPDPHSCVRHAPNFVRTHVKDPISMCRKRVVSQPVVWSHKDTAYTRLVMNYGWVARLLCRSWLSSGKSTRTICFTWEKFPLGQQKYLKN